MKPAAIAGIVLIVVVLFAVPLIAGCMGDSAPTPESPRNKLPEYAARMGLKEVARARYEDCPFLASYEETVECLGAPGVQILRPEDLPPMPIKSTVRLWTRHVEDPWIQVYAWVNEYDEVMVTTFQNGESVSQYSGQPPKG
jgi:hypothetical protein